MGNITKQPTGWKKRKISQQFFPFKVIVAFWKKRLFCASSSKQWLIIPLRWSKLRVKGKDSLTVWWFIIKCRDPALNKGQNIYRYLKKANYIACELKIYLCPLWQNLFQLNWHHILTDNATVLTNLKNMHVCVKTNTLRPCHLPELV